ncbi:MAG: hypothetical protein QOF79_2935 [Actinomycetota bacterium]|nr:hypothetical protein [Actinomycetota bacterium]
MLLIVALGLGAAVLYGASDFFGASAARRHHLINATTLNYAVAMVLLIVALPILGGTWSATANWAGSVAGALAVLGLISFYGVLAIGPMSLLSPLIALVQSAVPVAVAAFTGQGLNLTAWIAIAIAVVAILLLSPPPKLGRDHVSLRGAGLAIFSGLTLGASLVALDFAPENSGVIPAFWEIAVGLVILLLLLLAVRLFRGRAAWMSLLEPEVETASGLSSRRAWIEAAAAGLLAGVANIFVVTGLHVGNLAVIAVLIALYPVLTVILAATVLKERMTPLQFVGIGLAIGASLLFTAS